jgi:alkyl hydroperoxide reductase subunit D
MPELPLPHLDRLRDSLGEPARDIRLNVSSVLGGDVLTPEQTWGVALASAYFIGESRLRDALRADARAAGVGDAVFEDAEAAASLMGMNTVFYRFRHMVGKPGYAQRPARLRMQWMARPKTDKGTYELMGLALAALAGCEVCIKAHEASLLQNGLSEDHAFDAVRIAAVLQGFAIALQIGS